MTLPIPLIGVHESSANSIELEVREKEDVILQFPVI